MSDEFRQRVREKRGFVVQSAWLHRADWRPAPQNARDSHTDWKPAPDNGRDSQKPRDCPHFAGTRAGLGHAIGPMGPKPAVKRGLSPSPGASHLPSQTSVAVARPLVDGCGRHIDHLRLSLTERCNLACQYCSAGHDATSCRIDADFAIALVRWLSSRHAVRHVRLTGGEPLLHPEVTEIVGALSSLGPLDEITLTTNGQALAARASRLRQAGLTRINISLDTLRPDRFARLTRGGELARTLRGIEAAIAAELNPVRLNVVVQRGVNDDELGDLASWGLERGCTVRFLEVMPIGPMIETIRSQLVPAAEVLGRLSESFALTPVSAPPGQPATDFAAVGLRGGPSGRIGVIASSTRPFCSRCRRLRITARGEILSCLFDTGGSSLAAAWDGQELDEDAADRMLQAAVMAKPHLGHRSQRKQMISIGG